MSSHIAVLISSIAILSCSATEKKTERAIGVETATSGMPESSQDVPSGVPKACVSANASKRTSIIKEGQYTLVFSKSLLDSSTMHYCSERIDSHGSAFELAYVDPGGTGMDGYPNGVVGGVQNSGSWLPGNVKLTGMPVLLGDLDDRMIVQWKTSQSNAHDENDKWMASINLIFDTGDPSAKPDPAARDYDLVIESYSFRFNNSTEDVTEGSKRNYFARNKDGSLRTFDIVVDGKVYKYAVRYKFYYGRGDKDDKVHVKYIPIDEENVPPYLNHSIAQFIDNSREFIQYAKMPDEERVLANEKVAKATLYLKSIRAGYEVYQGESTLRNDFFRVVFD